MNEQSRKVLVGSGPDDAMAIAADLISEKINAAVKLRGVCNMSLAGGSTPRKLYELLSTGQYEIPWNSVKLFFGDERCVSAEDPLSNANMVRGTLLAGLAGMADSSLRPQGLFTVPCGDMSPQVAAANYADTIIQNVPGDGSTPIFDIVLLGIGDDGHTASLFPDELALLDNRGLVVAGELDHGGCRRVSFTLRLINAARCVVFLAVGKAKSPAVARACAGESSATEPQASSLVFPVDGELIFVLDEDSASGVDMA